MTIEAQINYLKKRGQFVDDYLEFFQQILSLQSNQQSKIDKKKLSVFGKTTDIETRISSGIPWLDKQAIYLEETIIQSGFGELFSIFEKYPQQYPSETIDKLKKSFDKSELLSKEFIQKFISADKDYFNQLSKDTEIEFSILIYIARTLVFPFLKEYGELFKQQLTKVNSIWFRPFCPLCGNMPAMARLEKEVGQRYLWCTVCHQDWQFNRLQCPHCTNDDQKSIRYFYDENKSQYRVYVCEKCKHYIKTVDERTMAKNQQANMFLEDLITHYLDELALKQGYLSMLWWNANN